MFRRWFPCDDLFQPGVAKLLQVHRAVGVKVVNDVRFVALANRVEVYGPVFEPQREPAVDGVDGYHEEDAYDVPLQSWHPVVLEVLRDFVECDWDGEEDKDAGDEPGDEVRGPSVAVHVPRAQRERDEHHDVDEDPDGLEDLAEETRHHRALVAILAEHHHREGALLLPPAPTTYQCAYHPGARPEGLHATGFERPRVDVDDTGVALGVTRDAAVVNTEAPTPESRALLWRRPEAH